jgi:hypothetical protein
MVILSGYANPVYERVLIDWGTRTFQAKTHTDVRTETLWFNFEPPQQLHDNRHIGNNFRERQTIRRRMNRLQERVSRMDAVERSAFIEWLNEEYPMNDRSSSP